MPRERDTIRTIVGYPEPRYLRCRRCVLQTSDLPGGYTDLINLGPKLYSAESARVINHLSLIYPRVDHGWRHFGKGAILNFEQ